MGTLTDEDLRHLLGEAAGSYDVPDDGPALVLEEAAEEAEVVPFYRHRRVQVASAAAGVAAVLALGVALFGGNDVDRIGQLAGAQREPAVDTDGMGTSDEQGAQFTAGSTGGGTAGEGFAPTSESARLYSLDAVAAPRAAAPQVAVAAGAPAAAGGTAAGTAGTTGGGAQAAAPAPAAPTADGARVVKTGAIALVVEDGRVTPVLTQVQSLATAVGGEVAVAQTQELGPTPSGSVTLRVPVDSFEEVVAKVRSLDAEVRSATTAGKDVTAQYADIEAQIRTLTAARERFLEILSRARTIGDVLAVQQRVDDATGKIDRLEGQRRVLASQSERATLEVVVTEADDPVVTEQKPDDGLSKAFADAWQGFTTGVEGLIRLSGRGILLLLCLAVAFAVLRLGWRASRRRLV
jgi:hypothetical protein